MSNMDRDFPGEDYSPPESVLIAGTEVKAGDRVRLHPKARGDAFDMLLDGRTVRVEVIHQDFENRIYMVVMLDDDHGRDPWGEVAQRLMNRKTKQYPQGVQVVDFGIRGIDLAYTLLDHYDTLMLVDAVSRGGPPGTLYLIEPDLAGIDPEKGVEAGRAAMDAH